MKTATLSAPPIAPIFFLAAFFFAAPVFAGQNIAIEGGTINHDVYGNGTQPNGDTPIPGVDSSLVLPPNHNTITVSGATVQGFVEGGYTAGYDFAAASRNAITIINSQISGYIEGGFVRSVSSGAETSGNKINIANSNIGDSVYGGLGLAETFAIASKNEVTLRGGSVNGSVFGGHAHAENGAATAHKNNVSIAGSVSADIIGGESISVDGNASSSGNSVTIKSGGEAGGRVYGGRAQGGEDAAANGNSVTIERGGKVENYVYGGHARSHSGIATATHNSVTISDAAAIGASTRLYGGMTDTYIGTAGDAFSGNTLNLKVSGLTARTVANFENLNFYLPAGFSATSDALLTVANTAQLTENDDGTGRSSVVTVIVDGASSPLKKGDKVTLIDASAGTLVTNSSLNARGIQGVTLKYELGIEAASNQLTATVTAGPKVNPQTKSLSEGFLSGAAFLHQGADFAADQGMEAAVKMAASALGRGAFAAISVGSSRYKTGSHVDVDGFSLMAGLSWGKALSAGRVTLGGFFEYGNGSYDTYNSFSNAAKVRGKGDLKQYGAGILGRFDAAAGKTGNWYAEASLRAGKIENDYKSSDLRAANGVAAKYDASSAYASAHLGAGYVWKLTEQSALDLYGKAFWTRQEGDTVKLSTGEKVKFEDADSTRVRLGGRFSYAVNERLTPYAGLAWEHEFDGKAKAKTNGYDIDAPKLKGDTGAAEFGLVLKPAAASPLSLDLGVQGYAGRREGVTGSVRMRYEF